jgi:hypothetical protein
MKNLIIMKTFKTREKSEIDRAQESIKIKSIVINTIVLSILSFIAVMLIVKIA